MAPLTDDDLLRRLSEVVRDVRRVEADLVALIAEVDARRLYAREAMPSMFAYCTEVLHLSEPEAILRIRVARASRQHPMLLTELREGRLHLSGIALLAPLLTSRNRESLLKRATHRSKEQVRELVAELAPRPDVASRMRRLPGRGAAGLSVASPSVGEGGPAPGTSPLGRAAASLCPDTVGVCNSLSSRGMPRSLGTVERASALGAPSASRPDAADLTDAAVLADAAAPRDFGIRCVSSPAPPAVLARPSAPPARPATIEPLSPARYKVQFTASAELREKLLRLKALMRSSVPDGDLGAIVEAAVTEKLERLEARRFGKTASPRKVVADVETTPTSRHVPAPVRRAVHERDGGRCTYRDVRGIRCPARGGLEFHHHGRPFGFGGVHSVRNVRLMCRAHNQLLADCDYGKEKMAGFRPGTGSAGGIGAEAAGAPCQGEGRGSQVEGVKEPGGCRSP